MIDPRCAPGFEWGWLPLVLLFVAAPSILACAQAKRSQNTASQRAPNDGETTGPPPFVLPPGSPSAAFGATDAVWPNPERGLYRTVDLLRTPEGQLAELAESGFRLVGGLVLLSDFRDGPLPQDWLAGLNAAFARLRAHGLKIVLRFAYSDAADAEGGTDAPLATVIQHIGALAPVVQGNADIIAFWQAGFIGAWGEWHSSSHNLTEPDARLKVFQALMMALPRDRFLQVRNPRDLMAWFPQGARAGGDAARVGWHNDCFLANETDMGTFSRDDDEAEMQRQYLQEATRLVPFGGETCNPGEGEGRGSCEEILMEGRAFHLTYLNADYFVPSFHDRWKEAGCWYDVLGQMGYRIVLKSVSHASAAPRGSAWRLKIEAANTGWAAPANPRPFVVGLRLPGGDMERLPLSDTDARQLDADASTTFFAEPEIPSALMPGDYEVLIGLPDPAPTLTDDPRFAIRFNNAEAPTQTWDAETGFLSTGTVVTVH